MGQMNDSKCIQELYAPELACFGCGPKNSRGLKLRSFVEGDALIAQWIPETQYEAFPGILNGGIIGSLLDCHCNWTAAEGLRTLLRLETPPCTVTAEYAIKLHRPTPTGEPVALKAKVVEIKQDRAVVEGTLEAGGKLCATCRGTFVAVKPGHPAFHRW